MDYSRDCICGYHMIEVDEEAEPSDAESDGESSNDGESRSECSSDILEEVSFYYLEEEEAMMSATTDPWERIRKMIRFYVSYLDDHVSMYMCKEVALSMCERATEFYNISLHKRTSPGLLRELLQLLQRADDCKSCPQLSVTVREREGAIEKEAKELLADYEKA